MTAERDKYGANDIKPGLTGWAQINGRDELAISEKARLDGEYCKRLGLLMDLKVFFKSIHVFRSDNSIVEGCNCIDKDSIFKNERDVTLSIVTFNNKEEIDVLMQSLQKSSFWGNMTVFIIDNASKDGTADYIKDNYPWARVIQNKENIGFGRAHNLVINNVHSKFHLIVNPDIYVYKDTIEDAISYISSSNDIVLVTPLMMNVDGTQQFLPKKNPSLKYMVGGMLENKFAFCKKLRDEYTMRNKKVDYPIDVDFCTGAFMITRTEALHTIGGFDEKYFLHFEDADLTRELKKIGRTVYNPDIVVVHKWHRDNKRIDRSFFIALKSMFIYFWKWR